MFDKNNKPSTETTVASTTIGGAIAVVLVFILDKTGLFVLNATEAGLLVGAFTTIFNYFVPQDFTKRFKFRGAK